MPSNWQSIDTNFPSFTGEETAKEQITALHNYLFQLRQGLQYSLQNLGLKNFNAAGLKELNEAQKQDVSVLLQGVTKSINALSGEVNNLAGRIRDTDKMAGQIADIEEWTGAAEEQLQELNNRLSELEQILKVETDGSITIGLSGRTINLVGDIHINGTLWQPEPPAEELPEGEELPEEETNETT